MEAIKKLLSPGKDKDDETLYGQGSGNTTSTTPGGALSGEGSHFDHNKNTSSGLTAGQGSHFDQTRDTSSGLTGQQGTGLTNTQGVQPTTTSGPHSSNLANKADPRVDSDNSRVAGSSGTYETRNDGLGVGQGGGLGQRDHQQHGTSGIANTQTLGSSGAQTAGPHSSNLANKADPRVDSDNSKLTGTTGAYDSRNDGLGVGQGGGLGQRDHQQHGVGTGVGNTQSLGNSGTQTSGPHNSDLLNKADPRVDSDNSKSHQYGSDAAVAGTAGGAAYGASQQHGNTTSGPHNSDLLNKADPRVDSDNSKSHQYAGDAAVAGTAGGAAYGASQQHGNTTSGPHSSDLANRADPRVDSDNSKLTGQGATGGYAPTSGGSYHTGPSGTAVSGPHSTSTANRLDPSVNPTSTRLEDAHEHDPKHGGGAEAADHHHGRNTALAGGAAAVGAGAYGASRNDHSTTTSGPHDSNLANRADPRVDSDRSNVVGGVGHGKSGQTHPHGVSTTTTTHTSTSTSGPHTSDLANKADPRVDSDNSKAHNHGRDAALVGGAGVAGAGAYGAHKHNEHDEKDLKKAEKEAEKDRKHAEKEHEKNVKHAEKDHDKHEKKEHKGLLSFLHRDKSKKYTKEEEDEFDRQEREHDSNTKRNTALGTGAAAGGAAYGAHHAGHADTNKPLPGAPGSSTTGHSSTTIPEAEKPAGTTLGDKLHGVERNRGVPGPTGFPDEQAKHNIDEFGNPRGSVAGQGAGSNINRGHDGTAAGLGLGAGTGAGALGSNDHRNEQIGTAASANQHHSSGGIGSGGLTDRTRHGDDTTTHGSGLTGSTQHGTTSGQYDNTTTQGSSGLTGSSHNTGIGHSGTTSHSSGLTGTQHNTGLGHSGNTSGQHDNTTSHGSGLTGTQHNTGLGHSGTTSGQYDNTTSQGSSGLTGSSHNTGLGHSGTTSGQYDNTNPQGSALTSSNQTSGLTGSSNLPGQHDSNTTGSHGLGEHGSTGLGDSGRNRLHKDPPAGHLASQSGLQSEGTLEGDNNGVKNSRAGENTY